MTLKELRIEKGLSQAACAEVVGVPLRTGGDPSGGSRTGRDCSSHRYGTSGTYCEPYFKCLRL